MLLLRIDIHRSSFRRGQELQEKHIQWPILFFVMLKILINIQNMRPDKEERRNIRTGATVKGEKTLQRMRISTQSTWFYCNLERERVHGPMYSSMSFHVHIKFGSGRRFPTNSIMSYAHNLVLTYSAEEHLSSGWQQRYFYLHSSVAHVQLACTNVSKC